MESLSGKLFVMIVEARKYWESDYFSLFLRGIPVWKTSSFLAVFSNMAGGDSENVICFLILRLVDLPKNVPVFLEAIFPTL